MINSPIKSGWRGDQQGYVGDCEGTHIHVSEITLKLDRDTAYALCNQLLDSVLESSSAIEKSQKITLSTLGAAIGRLIDHGAANNGGRNLIK